MNPFCRSANAYISCAAICAALFVFFVHAAWGESLAFRGTWNSQSVAAAVDTVEVDGETFVPLAPLVNQLGGGLSVDQDRIQLEFGAERAWVDIGGRTAYGTLDRVSLAAPINYRDGDVLLALDDVPRLFSTCFKIQLSHAGSSDRAERTQTAGVGSAPLEDPFAPEVMDGLEVTAPKRVENAPTFSRIYLDAGHGGADTGAIGPTGLEEKTVTLAVAQALKEELERLTDAEVAITRTDDRELSAEQRGNAAVRAKADLFISLHTGASLSRAAFGFEVFCSPSISSGLRQTTRVDISMDLAESIEREVVNGTGTASRGVRQAPLRPLANLNIPCLLIELGCITNPTEETMLQSEEYQRELAASIAAGIAAYMGSAPGGTTG